MHLAGLLARNSMQLTRRLGWNSMHLMDRLAGTPYTRRVP